MEKISIKELYKNEIDEIWNNAMIDNDLLSRGYAVHDQIIKNAILFIGINPSYSGKNLVKGSHFINNNEDEKLYKYFKKFQKISDEIKQPWTHLDLLYFRKTRQKYISELLQSNEKSYINFINSQLELSKQMIFKAEPKIIVVSNTMAKRFMGLRGDKDKIKNTDVWMDFDSIFDNDLGTHRLTNTDLKGTPVFFTSMLTGQRALDNGSFDRLVWHINFVLEKLKNSNS